MCLKSIGQEMMMNACVVERLRRGEGWSTEERSARMQIPDPFIKACVEQGLILGVAKH